MPTTFRNNGCEPWEASVAPPSADHLETRIWTDTNSIRPSDASWIRTDPLNRIPLETILAAISRIEDLEHLPPGTTVLVRADVDVPLESGRVVDPNAHRVDGQNLAVLPGPWLEDRRLRTRGPGPRELARAVCVAMRDCLGIPFQFVEDWLDEENCRLNDDFVGQVRSAEPGAAFVLQNTRKYALERALWDVATEQLPSVIERMYAVCSDIRTRLCGIEINEAIAASNVDFSSSVVPLMMDRNALGFYLSSEMRHVLGVRAANFVVFSGQKIDKLDALEAMLKRNKIRLLMTAGALAMALRKARAQLDGTDFFLGRAETDPSHKAYIPPPRVEQAKRILLTCEAQKVAVVLPVDFILDDGSKSTSIGADRCQLDVGPKTRDLFAPGDPAYIQRSRAAGSPSAMFYNGVFGKFEDSRFEAGTKSFIPLLKEMTAAGIATYVGGGEGRLALAKYGALTDVTHAFTAGGTILKSLSDEHLAFLKAMYLQRIAPRHA